MSGLWEKQLIIQRHLKISRKQISTHASEVLYPPGLSLCRWALLHYSRVVSLAAGFKAYCTMTRRTHPKMRCLGLLAVVVVVVVVL